MKPAYTAEELAAWTVGEWYPSPPVELTGVCHDTRELSTGNLYVALRGANHDGHTFVDTAFRRGAAGALVAADGGCEGTAERPLLVVPDTLAALRRMAATYRLKTNPHIVAVTGSVGKSTVKEMTGQLLAACVPTARTQGNWNNEIGLPLSLLAMPGDVERGVFEVGMNRPGEIVDLCRILKPAWGIVTNVGPVHMEFFRSVADIAEEKAALLTSLPATGVAFLDRDGAFFDLLAGKCPGRVVTVGRTDAADYVCTVRDPALRQVGVLERSSGHRRVLRLPSVSAYNVTNALFAIAVARSLDVEWPSIQGAFDAYEPLPMRWQEIAVADRVVVNDAYNANPVSMQASLDAFAEREGGGAKWLVLAGMNELGGMSPDAHLGLGRLVGKGDWDGLILVGELGEGIARGAEESGFAGALHRASDAKAAARLVRSETPAGCAILLKASRGMHLEKIVDELKLLKERPDD